LKKNLIFFILISLSNAYEIKPYIIKSIINTQIDINIGDWTKGKEIFEKYLKYYCGLSNDKFTIIHTQDEWEDIVQAGKFREEILKICPKLKEIYKDEWSPHLYQFAYKYASDSGDIPYN
jgi:hypothetical protein